MIRSTLLSALVLAARGQSNEQLGNTAALGDLLGGSGSWGDATIVYQGGYISFNGTGTTVEEWGGGLLTDSFGFYDGVICFEDTGAMCYDTTTSPPTTNRISNVAVSSVTVGNQPGGTTVFELDTDSVIATDFATSTAATFPVESLDQSMIACHPAHNVLIHYNATDIRGYTVTMDLQNTRVQGSLSINMTIPTGITSPTLTSNYFLYGVGPALYGIPLLPSVSQAVQILATAPTNIQQMHASDKYLFIVGDSVITIYDLSSGLPVSQGTDVPATDINIMLEPDVSWQANGDVVYVERFTGKDVIVKKGSSVTTPTPAGPGNITTPTPGSGNNSNNTTPTPGSNNNSTPAPGGGSSTPSPDPDNSTSDSGNMTDDAPVALESDDETILGFSFTLFIIIFGGGGLLVLILLIAVVYCLCCKKSMANFDEFQPLNQMFEGNLISDTNNPHQV